VRLSGSSSSARVDPLALLVEYCEEVLPLPTFEAWLVDVTLHPVAHLDDLDDSADVPTFAAPATFESRSFEYRGRPWLARLRTFRDGAEWRGYISFTERRSGETRSTAIIFCESHPTDLRERFLSFDLTALEAFLRSTLP
jgi:hypothetical protein